MGKAYQVWRSGGRRRGGNEKTRGESRHDEQAGEAGIGRAGKRFHAVDEDERDRGRRSSQAACGGARGEAKAGRGEPGLGG